jgi:hypothetical protein
MPTRASTRPRRSSGLTTRSARGPVCRWATEPALWDSPRARTALRLGSFGMSDAGPWQLPGQARGGIY